MSAALAAIGVQGYWLFNQFRYEMCTYADEIAGEVFHAGQEESFHFGNTTFNYTTNEIRTGNNKVLITSRQADLLRILATNLNLAVDRDLLLETVWGTSSYANSLALNVQVTYLRKALHNDPSTGIVSLPKKGYMLRG